MNKLILKLILFVSINYIPQFSLAQANISYDKSGNRLKMAIVVESIHLSDSDNLEEFTQKNKVLNKFSVYPNPTKGNVDIKNELSDISYDLKIFDINGKLIIEKACKNESGINLINMNDGIYVLEIIYSGHNKRWKIIKQ